MVILFDNFLPCLRVEPSLQSVDSQACGIVSFHSVAVDHVPTTRLSEYRCSSARRPRVALLVLFVVCLITEHALSHVEIDTVERHDLREKDLLYSLGRSPHAIAEDEAPSLVRMPMQVYVHEELSLCILVEDGSFHRINCGMENWVGVSVYTVQIQALRVIAPVASSCAVWIE